VGLSRHRRRPAHTNARPRTDPGRRCSRRNRRSVPRDIKAAADGPVDAVVDVVGVDDTLQWASNVLGPDGHLVLAGIGGGTLDFSWNPLVGSEVTYRTVQWGTPAELRDVLTLARHGRLETDVHPIDLEDLPQTFERLRDGTIEGRAVAVP